MHIFKLFLLFHFTTTLLFSQGYIKKPFLWKVTNDKQEFYLFGTMHLPVPKLQILPQNLVDIINRSDVVYTEIPMERSAQREANRLVMRADKRRLKEILPPSLYTEIKWYLYRLNPKLSISLFDKMKVWGVSSALMSLKNQLQYPNFRAIDKIIYDYAKSRGKVVLGIERVREQLSIMDKFTEKEHIIALEQALIQLNDKRDYIEELKTFYLQGESQKLMRFIESMMYQLPKYKNIEDKFLNLLLYQRNLTMATRISKIIKQKPNKKYLFAFGVMHFLGDKSVIEYLESYGYKVKRID